MSRTRHSDRHPFSLSQLREDELDWQENQRRSTAEMRRTDEHFLRAWVSISAVWLAVALAISAFGGLAVVATHYTLLHILSH